MKELGYVLAGCLFISGFFMVKIYPDLEYTGGNGSGSHQCIGQCYANYVEAYGTAPEIERRKMQLVAADTFGQVRGTWTGCAACHGQAGEGGVGPMLAGQSASMITDKLTTYKNKGQIGPMSSLMWGQASMLTESDIKLIGQFIEEGLPK
jgi:cytochrome c553